MSSISELSSQVADLSLSDKLSLIETVVASIRKEGGMPSKKTKGSKAEKADKPKRKAALGTRAWTAYVKHMKTSRPEAFEGLTKESDKLVIVKGIRAEDPDGYTAFTEAWKAEHAETSSVEEASVAETASVAEAEEPPAPKVKKAQKPAPKPEKLAPKAEKEAEKPKAAAKKPVKKEAKKVVKETPPMPQKEIDGVSYWHDPETNGLWEVTGPTVADGMGEWIGYFQPDDEEEPIRFTEAFGSD
jgi:hypothetical protein